MIFFSHYKFWGKYDTQVNLLNLLTIIFKDSVNLKKKCALIWACMFIQSFKKFRPVCLIRSVCLLIYRKMSLLYAYSEQTSIRDTRVRRFGQWQCCHIEFLSRFVDDKTKTKIHFQIYLSLFSTIHTLACLHKLLIWIREFLKEHSYFTAPGFSRLR